MRNVLRIQTHYQYCNLLYSQCMLNKEVILNAGNFFSSKLKQFKIPTNAWCDSCITKM